MLVPLIAAIAAAVIVHLGGMALAARNLGIAVRSVTLGVGPTVFTIGRLRIAPLPLGGSIGLAMLDGLEPGERPSEAFDSQPTWKRVALPLCGLLALLTRPAACWDPGARG